jgi:hypothetical protein
VRSALLAIALALAPLQCGSPPSEHPELEDSPAEAVWDLSERFAAQGDDDARRSTLEYLIERYPSSRFAERARVALGRASAP